MRIVVTNANEEAKKGYMKKLIQTFIETKMKAFRYCQKFYEK
mgnify:CR=1 FL=1